MPESTISLIKHKLAKRDGDSKFICRVKV